MATKTKTFREYLAKQWEEATRNDFDPDSPIITSILNAVAEAAEAYADPVDFHQVDRIECAKDTMIDLAIDCLNFARWLSDADVD